ncbi:MAG: histidinol-phosphate transaminase [Leptospirales bacterium]|nr:histidinol-phosphate transaminase [Leptospirales bacterium]
MKYWNKTLADMQEYIYGEQPGGTAGFVKLNTNENPFPPSKDVIEAIKKHADDRLRLYPDAKSDALRKIFAEENGLSTDNVFVGNGSDEIFTLIFRGFIEKDGVAAFPYPSYSLYYTLAQGNGIAHKKVQLEDDFSYNMDKFLNQNFALVIISNPNNPTGTYCPADEIARFCEAFEGLLVVDEAYIDFYGGSSIELVNKFDNIIITRSMSKSYSLAGLRVGLAAANKDIISGLMKIKDSYNVDTLSQAGAVAALLDKKTFNSNITYNMRNNKDYLEERLAAMDFTIVPSRANFLFVKHSDISAEEIYLKLKEKKILVRHLKGERQSDYVRISVGSMGEIKSLCKELESICNVSHEAGTPDS